MPGSRSSRRSVRDGSRQGIDRDRTGEAVQKGERLWRPHVHGARHRCEGRSRIEPSDHHRDCRVQHPRLELRRWAGNSPARCRDEAGESTPRRSRRKSAETWWGEKTISGTCEARARTPRPPIAATLARGCAWPSFSLDSGESKPARRGREYNEGNFWQPAHAWRDQTGDDG